MASFAESLQACWVNNNSQGRMPACSQTQPILQYKTPMMLAHTLARARRARAWRPARASRRACSSALLSSAPVSTHARSAANAASNLSSSAAPCRSRARSAGQNTALFGSHRIGD